MAKDFKRIFALKQLTQIVAVGIEKTPAFDKTKN